MTSSGVNHARNNTIARIDIVHKNDFYMWDEIRSGYDLSNFVRSENFRGYATTLSEADAEKSYYKIYNSKLPERVSISNDGYFVQTAGKFSFSVDSDDWTLDYLLYQKGQVRKGYQQQIEFPAWAELLDAKHTIRKTKLCDDIPVSLRYFDTNNAMCEQSITTGLEAYGSGSFYGAGAPSDTKTVIDYFYNDLDLDISDYICCVINTDGDCIFSGFINSDGVEFVEETKIVKISATSLLIALSQASQKNSIIYYKPSSSGTVKNETNIKNITYDVFRNLNRMFLGRDPKWEDVDDMMLTKKRTMKGLLHPEFSGDFSEIPQTRQCTEPLVLSSVNSYTKPTDEQLSNKGYCFPMHPLDLNGYDISEEYTSIEVFANPGSGGLMGITFVSKTVYLGRKNPNDMDEIRRFKIMCSISHFRYRRGILENSVSDIANFCFTDEYKDTNAVLLFAVEHKLYEVVRAVVDDNLQYSGLANIETVLFGLDKTVKINVFAKKSWYDASIVNIMSPEIAFNDTSWRVVETGTEQVPLSYYDVKAKFERTDGYVAGMPVYSGGSEYYEMRPMNIIFSVDIKFTGNDYVERYIFNSAEGNPRSIRIGELLKIVLFMGNISITENVYKAIISKREIKVNDETYIKRVNRSDMIDLVISQGKIEIPTVDLSQVLESDVGVGGDENGAAGINSYSNMLNEKYSAISKLSKNRVATKISSLFNEYLCEPGNVLNISNKLYEITSVNSSYSISEIKGMSIIGKPFIDIFSIGLNGTLLSALWTNNNVSESFDVDIKIERVSIDQETILSSDIIYGVNNSGKFRYDVYTTVQYSDFILRFTIMIDYLEYSKSASIIQLYGGITLTSPQTGAIITSANSGVFRITWTSTLTPIKFVDVYFREEATGIRKTLAIKVPVAPLFYDLELNKLILNHCDGFGFIGISISGFPFVFSESRVNIYEGVAPSQITVSVNQYDVVAGVTVSKISWSVSGPSELCNTDILLIGESGNVEYTIVSGRPHQWHEDGSGFAISYPDSIDWVAPTILTNGQKSIKVVNSSNNQVFGISLPIMLSGCTPSDKSISIARPHIGYVNYGDGGLINESWTNTGTIQNVDIYLFDSIHNIKKYIAQNIANVGYYQTTLSGISQSGTGGLTSLVVCDSSNSDVFDSVSVEVFEKKAFLTYDYHQKVTIQKGVDFVLNWDLIGTNFDIIEFSLHDVLIGVIIGDTEIQKKTATIPITGTGMQEYFNELNSGFRNAEIRTFIGTGVNPIIHKHIVELELTVIH